MPRPALRLPGILLALSALAVFADAGCSALDTNGLTASAPVRPTPAAAQATHSNAPWAEDLIFSGELTGNVAGTAPADTVKRSECTGKESRHTGSWASTFLLDISGQRVALVILVPGYAGAGAQTKAVTVEVHTDDLSRVWENQPGDIVSFLVGADEESGRLDVVLSNVSALDAKLRIVGRWTCRT